MSAEDPKPIHLSPRSASLAVDAVVDGRERSVLIRLLADIDETRDLADALHTAALILVDGQSSGPWRLAFDKLSRSLDTLGRPGDLGDVEAHPGPGGDHDGAAYSVPDHDLETSPAAREPAAPADGPNSEPSPRLCFDPLGALRYAPRFEWGTPEETKAEIEAEFAALARLPASGPSEPNP